MKIYKIYSLMGLCYIYSMNPVEGELTDVVEIELPSDYHEVERKNGMRGIVCPDGYVATGFCGPNPTIYEHKKNNRGSYLTFQLSM
jgi:hypothetical protein